MLNCLVTSYGQEIAGNISNIHCGENAIKWGRGFNNLRWAL